VFISDRSQTFRRRLCSSNTTPYTKTPKQSTFFVDYPEDVPGSVVSIATGYGLEGPGIESWWGGGQDFPHLSIPALGPTQPPVQ